MSNKHAKIIETDVLVVGGAGAGLSASIAASNRNVVVANKGMGATCIAPGAIAGVGSWCDEKDSKDLHFKDFVVGGAFLNEQNLVRIIVDKSPEKIVELERFGAFWERTDDGKRYLLRDGGGHTYWRSVYCEDHTGREALRALESEAKRRNVRVYNSIMVTKLLVESGSVVGATAVDLNFGGFIAFKAKAVILATGGAGQVYSYNSQPRGCCGDGFALALHAGAELIDMEFVQFFPIGLAHPEELKGILCATPYYVHLLNSKGERFMNKYDPRLELATRDILSRAMFREIKEGRGTSHGGLYCDATFMPLKFFEEEWPSIYNRAKGLGIDLTKDLLEVVPTVHYFMGGVRVNEKWESTIRGLFAAGEVVGGVHGANRVGQNSLADVIVSGSIAGESASEYLASADETHLPSEHIEEEYERVHGILASPEIGRKPSEIKLKIRNTMWNDVGIIRNEKGLEEGFDQLTRIRTEDLPRMRISSRAMRFNKEWIDALEIPFMLDVGEAIAMSALYRKESRGAHFREDYPHVNNEEFLKHNVIKLDDGHIKLGTCPVNLSEIKPK